MNGLIGELWLGVGRMACRVDIPDIFGWDVYLSIAMYRYRNRSISKSPLR